MKRIFTLIISSLISTSLLAYGESMLSISAFSPREDIVVEINGRRYDMKDNSMTFRNLSDGPHRVAVLVEKNRGRGHGHGRRPHVIYSNTVFLKRGFHTDIVINRFGKALVDEQPFGRFEDRFDDDYGFWDDRLDNVMNPREFAAVKEQIRKEWFEKNRLSSAKFIIDRNFFSTEQVRELMLLFTFEDNRLEVAKYAYSRTVDQHNYMRVADVLNFSSSRDELMRFIRNRR